MTSFTCQQVVKLNIVKMLKQISNGESPTVYMKPSDESSTFPFQCTNTSHQVPGGDGVAADLHRSRLSDSRRGVQPGSCASHT